MDMKSLDSLGPLESYQIKTGSCNNARALPFHDPRWQSADLRRLGTLQSTVYTMPAIPKVELLELPTPEAFRIKIRVKKK
jgi:hypothetical protein